jgi:hypothetical protein
MELTLKNSKTKKTSEEKSSVFVIVCSATPSLHSMKFFATKELARARLKKLADERRHNLGVHWHEETEDKFSYTLGWEEHYVFSR